jgi:hypothetical protein
METIRFVALGDFQRVTTPEQRRMYKLGPRDDVLPPGARVVAEVSTTHDLAAEATETVLEFVKARRTQFVTRDVFLMHAGDETKVSERMVQWASEPRAPAVEPEPTAPVVEPEPTAPVVDYADMMLSEMEAMRSELRLKEYELHLRGYEIHLKNTELRLKDERMRLNEMDAIMNTHQTVDGEMFADQNE